MTTNHAKRFSESLRNVIQAREMSQNQFAIQLGYGAQYLSDILLGKRTPSVRFVNAVCNYLRLGQADKKEWHTAAAKCHGWNV